ncbi:long-chain fatty acid--CoA ligase [Sphingomonas ginsenosidivorax]|uniref:Long-chain fatty acid--CoA ligase n=1 Tax=Sphingomonas ginsenosidivorax TaxID=862135 RepID=A0A5C6UK22_9SPHN|nr:long-chain fatty acid--CoA ligase [Sphingomonas ginsenosidivorax]
MLSLQNFAAAVGEEFALDLGTASVALALVEAKPLSHGAGGLRHPFSLVFRAASHVVLPQKIYSLANATLGRHGIFLVPIGRDPAGVLYQAVFN